MSEKAKTFNSFEKDISQFEKGELLGSGSFAKVFLATEKTTRKQYAAKVSNVDLKNIYESQKKDISREINISAIITHPSIIKFYGYSMTDFKHRDKLVILTEYIQNGSLKNFIINENKSLSPDEWNFTKKLIIIYGIASGMSFLHYNNIIHRDLKPENILIDRYFFPKIADFGLSKSLTENISQSFGFIGTLKYAAPEALYKPSYNKASDVYSFSIIVYELLTSNDPFQGFNKTQILINAATETRPILDDTIPEAYKKLISDCWLTDPEKRPTFNEIVERLKNDPEFLTDEVDVKEFFNYVDFIDSYQKEFDKTGVPLLLTKYMKNKSVLFLKHPVIKSNPQKIEEKEEQKQNQEEEEDDDELPKLINQVSKSQFNIEVDKINLSNEKQSNSMPNSPENKTMSKTTLNLPLIQRRQKRLPNLRFIVPKSQILTQKLIKTIDFNQDSSDDYSEYDETENEEEEESINKDSKPCDFKFASTMPNLGSQNSPRSQSKERSSWSSITPLKLDEIKYNSIIYPAKELNLLSPECKEFVSKAENNPQLQFLLATYLIKGEKDFPKNSHLGIKYLKHSINNNCVDSIIYYCEILTKETHIIPTNVQKAKKLLKNSFFLNDSRIYLFYGRIIAKENNITKAKKFFRLALKEGNADAQLELGLILLEEKRHINRTEEIIECFEMAKFNGNKKGILFCTIINELHNIQGFNTLSDETKNFFIQQVLTYFTNSNCDPNMSPKLVPINLRHGNLYNFYKNKNLMNYAFDNVLKYFQSISVEIDYPSKKYHDIYSLIFEKKIDFKPNLNVTIVITGIKEIKEKFGLNKVINKVIIDSSVQSIQSEISHLPCNTQNGVFSCCFALEEIIIHPLLSSLGKWTFSYSSLAQIMIPMSVTTIEQGCFSCCKSLHLITIPNSVKSIEDRAFYGCSSLPQLTIPQSVVSIGNSCFEECTALEHVDVPSSLESIGDKAFYNCSSLKTFLFPSSIKTVGNLAFFGCNSLEYIKKF